MSESKSSSKPVSDDDLLASAIPIESDDEDESLETLDENDEVPDASSGSAASSSSSKADKEDDMFAPIDIEDFAHDESGEAVSKIQMFGERKAHEDHWQRKPNVTGKGAIHVKTFVAKLRYDAIEHLDEQVNQWLDNHPEYEVKFVTTTVGELRGKLLEPALFMNVWV